jgi:hypothetical protein
LVKVFKEENDLIVLDEQMIEKMQLIAKMHGEVIDNVGQTQEKHKHAYASQKGRHVYGIH